METTVINIRSYAEIAEDFALWQERIDPLCTVSREQWDALSASERIALIVETFGPEPTDEEIAEDLSLCPDCGRLVRSRRTAPSCSRCCKKSPAGRAVNRQRMAKARAIKRDGL